MCFFLNGLCLVILYSGFFLLLSVIVVLSIVVFIGC